MREVNEEYSSGAEQNIRNVSVEIITNEDSKTYTSDEILSVDIQRGITDGSFGVGFTQSDRLIFQVISGDKLPKKTRTTVYISFDGSDSERLGRFYVDECTRDGSVLTITAFDKMKQLGEKTVRFSGTVSGSLSKLVFPCTMQDVLDYICAYCDLQYNFTCQNFTVQKRPMKSEKEFFTVREMIGFIAGAHGCNAKIDGFGYLQIKPFGVVDYCYTDVSHVLDVTIDDSEPFEVTGVLLTVDGENSIYIDDVEGSEFNEEDTGVIKLYNPLATVEIAEYIWSRIGGLSYYGGSITQRGSGILEVGDVINVPNLKYPSDETIYPMCITNIDYSISASGGFIEILSSQADKSDNVTSFSDNSTMVAYGAANDPTGDTNTNIKVGDLWAENDNNNKLKKLYQYVVDDDNKKQWKLVCEAGSGVGKEVGTHSVILNDYDNNTVNNDDLSGRGYNLIAGTNNTLTYCARNSVSGGWNSLTNTQDSYVSGQGNEVTGGYGEIVGGHLNKLTGGSLGNIVGGQGNTGTQCTADIIGGQDHTVSRTRNALITGDNSTVNAAHNSIVGGEGHTVGGENSIVAGDHNAHIGSNAMTIGQNNTNTAWNSLALGMYGYNQSALLNIGYGSLGNYNNVFYIDTSGAAYAANGYHAIGADYAEYFEWADGNPEGEDRRGMLVSLDGDRIVPAHGDDILGAVSAYPSVIGNAFEEHWQGKYKHDIFGAPIYDEEGHQIIADGFDPDREYIPRSKRPEWAAIGMVGRLIVTDDGKCVPGKNVSAWHGIAVPTLSRTNVRCLRRIDNSHIEVLIK